MDSEWLRIDVANHAAEIVATCRLLAMQEQSGIGLAKLKQIAEYAELALDSEIGYPPPFAGRFEE